MHSSHIYLFILCITWNKCHRTNSIDTNVTTSTNSQSISSETEELSTTTTETESTLESTSVTPTENSTKRTSAAIQTSPNEFTSSATNVSNILQTTSTTSANPMNVINSSTNVNVSTTTTTDADDDEVGDKDVFFTDFKYVKTTSSQAPRKRRKERTIGGVTFTFMLLGGMVGVTLIVIAVAILIEIRFQKSERFRLEKSSREGSFSAAIDFDFIQQSNDTANSQNVHTSVVQIQ